MKAVSEKVSFSGYEKFVIFILAIVQFTVVLDFMIISPLSAILMEKINIGHAQFTRVVSAYGISAGISGFLAAGFADKFDRKRMLLFFYTGFIIGTLFCGLAVDYYTLMAARIVTGIFGGVLSSISFAIITDLFQMKVRGRVMGLLQMSFPACQILGIPLGLFLSNSFGWQVPFYLIVFISVVIYVFVVLKLKPVNEHLKIKNDKNAFLHLLHTLSNRKYATGFLTIVFMATGGFMLMPLAADFSVYNLKVTQEQLPIVYFATGIFTMIIGPLSGKLSDSIGKFRMFVIGSLIAMIMVYVYTNLGASPLWLVIVVNILLFAGVTARMISGSALNSGIPEPKDRGAYMGINSSVQYLSGGVASFIAGLLVTKNPDKSYLHYEHIGYTVMGSMVLCGVMMYFINRIVNRKGV